MHYTVDRDKLTGAELLALVTRPSVPTAICSKLCPVGPIGRLKMRTLFRCEMGSGSSTGRPPLGDGPRKLSAIMVNSRAGVGAPRMFSEIIDAADLSTIAACFALVPRPRPLVVRGIFRIPGKPAAVGVELQSESSSSAGCHPIELTFPGLRPS